MKNNNFYTRKEFLLSAGMLLLAGGAACSSAVKSDKAKVREYVARNIDAKVNEQMKDEDVSPLVDMYRTTPHVVDAYIEELVADSTAHADAVVDMVYERVKSDHLSKPDDVFKKINAVQNPYSKITKGDADYDVRYLRRTHDITCDISLSLARWRKVKSEIQK